MGDLIRTVLISIGVAVVVFILYVAVTHSARCEQFGGETQVYACVFDLRVPPGGPLGNSGPAR